LFKSQNLHEDTIRSWINEGALKAFKSGNAYYVYGAVLKQFLKYRRNHNRRKETELKLANTLKEVLYSQKGSRVF
jgi:hypothetical protein